MTDRSNPTHSDQVLSEHGKESKLQASRRVLKTIKAYLRESRGIALLNRTQRRLRIAETVSLGEKRFVSILEVDGQSFLVGGSGSSIALLATLTRPPQQPSFESVLEVSIKQAELL